MCDYNAFLEALEASLLGEGIFFSVSFGESQKIPKLSYSYIVFRYATVRLFKGKVCMLLLILFLFFV